MCLDEINKLKELWFAGEIELLKVLMEGAGLKYLNLDLYRLLTRLCNGADYDHYVSDGVTCTINNLITFKLYSENIDPTTAKTARECNYFDIVIGMDYSNYDFSKHEFEYSLDSKFIQFNLTDLNKIIFELPLDYEPTEIEML